MTLALVQPTAGTLVDQINQAYHDAEDSCRNMLEHALRCGHLLYEAKLTVDHGDWTGWLSANFAGSHRTANQWMQLAEAQRTNPQLLAELPDDSISTAIKAIQRPARSPATRAVSEPREIVALDADTFALTVEQITDLVRSFGGTTTVDRVRRWIERLTEPKATLCADCQAPVIQVIVAGQLVTANRYEWQPRCRCTKCIQTRNAHPGQPVSCPHCNSTGFTGTAKRPPGRMLAMDMAWSDTPHVRVIGERTDRREGECLHEIHVCGQQVAA